MLAGEQLGRRHDRGLAVAFDRVQHGEEGDDRLAAADVALQEPQHPAVGGHVGEDLVDRACLGAGQFERQALQRLATQASVALDAAPGKAALVRPDQGEGELVGQQLVVGEPASCRRDRLEVALGAGGVDGAEAARQAGQP
jgi:hypothetical protein